MKFTDLFTHSITEMDSSSVDFARLLTFLSFFIYNGLVIWNYVDTHKFDPILYGTGFAAIVGAGAAAVRIKLDTELKANPDRA